MHASVSPAGSATVFVDRGAAPVGKTHIQGTSFPGTFLRAGEENENPSQHPYTALTRQLQNAML